MIYIYPIGGLGNMLFHMASIWALAKDNNDDLTLVNVEGKILNLNQDVRLIGMNGERYRYLFNRFPNVDKINPIKTIEWPFRYSKLEYVEGAQYVGYFQCEKYFKHRKKEIVELFKPSNEFLPEIDKYSHLFNNISLHIRRGKDIKTYPNVFPLSSVEYYNEALSNLPQNLKVMVFADDIAWARQNFIGYRYFFVDEIDYVAFHLMSKMKYHIIANSSFSWWGAWLSDAEQVFAPKAWFHPNPEFSAEDIVPENWIKL